MRVLRSYIIVVIVIVAVQGMSPSGYAQRHIKDMDGIRASIIAQGNGLPDRIREATVIMDIRTLERIYELNTSLLTTIEAYFRMLKLVIAYQGDVPNRVIEALNEWLAFIRKQCVYDIEYLDAASQEVDNEVVIGEIETAKTNIQHLADITDQAIEENSSMLTE